MSWKIFFRAVILSTRALIISVLLVFPFSASAEDSAETRSTPAVHIAVDAADGAPQPLPEKGSAEQNSGKTAKGALEEEKASLEAARAPEKNVILFTGPKKHNGKAVAARAQDDSMGKMFLTTVFWLGVIVAMIVGGLYFVKKYLPHSRLVFGSGKIDVLERKFFDSKKSIFLVRVGRRLLVVGVAGDNMRCLSEISDAVEVDELAAKKPPAEAGRKGAAGVFGKLMKREIAAFGQKDKWLEDGGNRYDDLEQETKRLRESIRMLEEAQ